VLALASALVGTASAAAVAAFVTPARATYCGVSEGEPPVQLLCWRPSDGASFKMTARGAATKRFLVANRGYFDPAPGRRLRYGETWRSPLGWKCLSRRSGLTCTNRTGHGWWIGPRRGSRLF
jgi:hypothetical protein